jgi:hypothetical protein
LLDRRFAEIGSGVLDRGGEFLSRALRVLGGSRHVLAELRAACPTASAISPSGMSLSSHSFLHLKS